MELKEAIRIIEEAGGFVMFAEDIETENRDEYLRALEREEEREREELLKWQEERKQNFADMANDFDKMLGQKNFSITAIEDMVYGYGFDLDDLEDLIHNFY